LIEKWLRELQPAIVHLGAAPELLSPQDVALLKDKLPDRLIMRSVPVTGEESIEIARSYDQIADFLLLDSHRASDRQIGALGVTHDWKISRRIVELVRTPVILAGGLGSDNVADAIRAVRPAGVDSKTKTDQDGTHAKDLERVRRFHETSGDCHGDGALRSALTFYVIAAAIVTGLIVSNFVTKPRFRSSLPAARIRFL
jgi:phosphoribosylanthranilate isomerase